MLNARRRLVGPMGMAGMVGLWGAPSLIKSIQRGTITIAAASLSNTATITSVDLANSIIVWCGTYVAGGDANTDIDATRVELTNATTVTASVIAFAAASGRDVVYEVIEFVPGVVKSVQRGTLATAASQTGSATISAVDTSRANLSMLGFTTTLASTNASVMQFKLVLTDATTIDGRGFGGATRTVGYQVVEFF